MGLADARDRGMQSNQCSPKNANDYAVNFDINPRRDRCANDWSLGYRADIQTGSKFHYKIQRIQTHTTMKEQIKELIEYAKKPEYSEEGENYLSDGQMLDIVLEQLEKLIQ